MRYGLCLGGVVWYRLNPEPVAASWHEARMHGWRPIGWTRDAEQAATFETEALAGIVGGDLIALGWEVAPLEQARVWVA